MGIIPIPYPNYIQPTHIQCLRFICVELITLKVNAVIKIPKQKIKYLCFGFSNAGARCISRDIVKSVRRNS